VFAIYFTVISVLLFIMKMFEDGHIWTDERKTKKEKKQEIYNTEI